MNGPCLKAGFDNSSAEFLVCAVLLFVTCTPASSLITVHILQFPVLM